MKYKNAYVLTGGISTGKSTVGALLSMQGLRVIDADKIAHKVLDDSALKVADIFGSNVLKDGKIIREVLGDIIFNNKDKRIKLEEIVHPLIYKEILLQADEMEKYNKPYLVDIPLFYERGNYPFSNVIVVYTPRATQLQRLIDRDKIAKEDALKRLEAQIDIEKKKNMANFVIDNSTDLKNLQKECDKLYNKIIH